MYWVQDSRAPGGRSPSSSTMPCDAPMRATGHWHCIDDIVDRALYRCPPRRHRAVHASSGATAAIALMPTKRGPHKLVHCHQWYAAHAAAAPHHDDRPHIYPGTVNAGGV